MASPVESEHPFPWRAAAPSLAVSGVLLAVTICAGSVLFVTQWSASRALNEAQEDFNLSVELELWVHGLRGQLTEYVATGDERLLADLGRLDKSVTDRLMLVERVVYSQHGRLVVAEIRRTVSNLVEELHHLTSMEQVARRAEVVRLVNQVLDAQLLQNTEQHRALAEERLQMAQGNLRTLTTWTGWLLLTLGLGGAATGIFSGYNLARALRRQLVELTVSVNSATGSLGALGETFEPIQVSPTGDLSQVQSMVDLLADRVAGVVRRVQASERESMRQSQLAALGQLAAGLAHELRNPLTAIKTLVEAARDSQTGASLDDRDLQVVDEELGRLDATLQAFLDYARPPRMVRKEVDLRDVVQRTVQLAAPRAERQSTQIDVRLPGSAALQTVDPEQLRQVLLNLLLNALDAVGNGGRVAIALNQPSADTPTQISVEDTGPGIAPELLDQLFEPFISSKPSGSGLGLTISQRIVENHGGTLTAENRPEGGARLTVSLPPQSADAGAAVA